MPSPQMFIHYFQCQTWGQAKQAASGLAIKYDSLLPDPPRNVWGNRLWIALPKRLKKSKFPRDSLTLIKTAKLTPDAKAEANDWVNSNILDDLHAQHETQGATVASQNRAVTAYFKAREEREAHDKKGAKLQKRESDKARRVVLECGRRPIQDKNGNLWDPTHSGNTVFFKKRKQ